MKEKTISFKVSENVYKILRRKFKTFRVLFEPLAIQHAQNNTRETKYTSGIPKNSDELYISLTRIKKEVDELFEKLQDIKK